jgi:hypothetical protein
MRFEINLASHPYQDVQEFLLRWGVAVALLAVVTIGLVYQATHALVSWRQTRKEVTALEQQIADRDRKRAEVEAFLNRPENSETRDRSRFLNALIARKAFSWTEVFTDLEKLEVHLRVASPVREPAIELVSRIEQAPNFSHASIVSEGLQNANQQNRGQAEIWEFNINAIYIPAFARAQEPANAERASTEKAEAQAENPEDAPSGDAKPGDVKKPGDIKKPAETKSAGTKAGDKNKVEAIKEARNGRH